MTKVEAKAVIVSLRRFSARIEQIMHRIEGAATISRDEKESLQSLLRGLKADIKEAAKTCTATKAKGQLNHIEEAYFLPAVTAASANFTVAVNSHPIRANWYSCLYDVNLEITYLLSQLEHQHPAL